MGRSPQKRYMFAGSTSASRAFFGDVRLQADLSFLIWANFLFADDPCTGSGSVFSTRSRGRSTDCVGTGQPSGTSTPNAS